MSKIINTKNLKFDDVKTTAEYVTWLQEFKGITTTKQAIQYQLNNTDNIDYCERDGKKYIVMTENSKAYTPQ